LPSLRWQVAVLSATPPDSVTLTWWLVPGPAANTTVPLSRTAPARGLYSGAIPLPSDTALLLEYVVEAAWAAPEPLVLFVPVEGAQSVVVV